VALRAERTKAATIRAAHRLAAFCLCCRATVFAPHVFDVSCSLSLSLFGSSFVLLWRAVAGSVYGSQELQGWTSAIATLVLAPVSFSGGAGTSVLLAWVPSVVPLAGRDAFLASAASSAAAASVEQAAAASLAPEASGLLAGASSAASAASAASAQWEREVHLILGLALVMFHLQWLSQFYVLELVSPISLSVANVLKRGLMILASLW